MKVNKPDTFRTSNTPDTAEVAGLYSIAGTQMEGSSITQFAQRNELSHLREIIDLKVGNIESKLKSLEESIQGREGRFWIIVTLIVGSIVAIFLFALPDLYKKDYSEKIQSVHQSIVDVEKRVKTLENKPIIKK